MLSEVFRQVKDAIKRLNSLEDRNEINETRIDSLEKTILKNQERDNERDKKFSQKFIDLDRRISKLENSVLKIGKALEKTAKEEDIRELKHLVSLYSPFKNKGEKHSR